MFITHCDGSEGRDVLARDEKKFFRVRDCLSETKGAWSKGDDGNLLSEELVEGEENKERRARTERMVHQQKGTHFKYT